jgi:hypothetical protein
LAFFVLDFNYLDQANKAQLGPLALQVRIFRQIYNLKLGSPGVNGKPGPIGATGAQGLKFGQIFVV